MKFLSFLILIALFLLSFLVKIIKIEDPYFGSYLSRQCQTMSTIDAYAVEGINLLKPRTNCAGWPGYLIYEFPIFQAISAWVSRFTGNPIITARGINLFLALLSVFLVYAIASYWFNRKIAIYSALFFSFAPLNIMFHPSSLVDVSSVFFALIANLILLYWLKKNSLWFFVFFFISGSLCVLIKPPFLLPVVIVFAIEFIQQSSPISISNVVKNMRRYASIISCFVLLTVILLGWQFLRDKYTTGELITTNILRHLGWNSLFDLKAYIYIVLRFFRQFVNPFNALLFVLGVFALWRRYRKNNQIQLLLIPILYYLLFPNINFHHTYYSLILIPYLSMIAGLGASWVEDKFSQEESIKQVLSIRIFIYIFSAFVSFLMYTYNITTSLILPGQRYEKMTKEIGHYIKPFKYGIVYINRDGNFGLWEYLRDSPDKYLKSFFKDLSSREIKLGNKDAPLTHTAVLYALKIYGSVEYLASPLEIRLAQKQKLYNGELRYMIFYLFEEQSDIYKEMKPYSPIYESKEWIVYDLAK